MSWLSSIFSAIGAALGLIGKRSDLNNSLEMQTRDKARKEMEAENREIEAIKNKDAKFISNNLS